MPLLAVRERAYRRLTTFALASLLLLSASPAIALPLLPVDTLLAGVDHVGALCVAALHVMVAPFHKVFYVLLALGLGYALWDRIRAWRRLRAVLDSLDARPITPGTVWWSAASAAGLDPRLVRVVEGLPTPAFTAGLLTPRVYVAGVLPARLPHEHLVAVLAHERAHVARRDPLRLSVLRMMGNLLFWVPALKGLVSDLADDAELLADDAASRGRPLVLAQAILLLASWPEMVRGTEYGVGFGRPDLLDRRIRRLTGDETTVRRRVTSRSLAKAFVVIAVVWSSGLVVAHPLPSAAVAPHERHCEHEHEWAIAHLFCGGDRRGESDCPHGHDA
jgi:Zn-dependent protease with chaperone function